MATLETKMQDLWQKLGGDEQAAKMLNDLVRTAQQAEKAAMDEALSFKAAGTAVVSPKTVGMGTGNSKGNPLDVPLPGTNSNSSSSKIEGSPAEEAGESPEEEQAEEDAAGGDDGDEDENILGMDDNPEDIAGNMPVEALHAMIDHIAEQQMQKALEPLMAALQKFAKKETETSDALMTATDVMAETLTTLKSIQTANGKLSARFTKLEATVKELAGEVPRGIRNRPTEATDNVVSAEILALAEKNKPTTTAPNPNEVGANLDPEIAGFLFGMPALKNNGLPAPAGSQ